jgi:hypothetical protein
MSDDESFFMSPELAGLADLTEENPHLLAIEQNTSIVVVQCSSSDIVGGLRYFRRESDVTAVEMSSTFDSAVNMLQLIEEGMLMVDNLELHKGSERVFTDKDLTIDGYYISDIDPITGQALFGLKLSKKKQVL